jgi:hypothetical protein
MTDNNKIRETNDYEIFKILKGNRDINQNHVNKLVQSITEKDLRIPIVVDNNMYVMDGQHRLEAYKVLAKSLLYIIKGDFTLEDIRQVNSVNKTWSNIEYMKSFKKLGVESYVHLEWFYRTYRFGINECIQMLTNSGAMGKRQLEDFKKGGFVVTHLEKGKLIANRINKIGTYFTYYKKITFVKAMIFALQNPAFEWERFEKKLENFSAMLKNQGSRNDFIVNIERLYNQKTPNNKKIRLEIYNG